MALRSPMGFLVPFNADLSVDSAVPMLAGANALGRNNLPVSDRRVSRRHASLHVSGDGGAELVVEGPNPIAFRSGNQRKMLYSRSKTSVVNGDVLELIPGRYFFKYMSEDSEKHTPSSNTDECCSPTGKISEDKEALKSKRKRHALEEETLMRPLQGNVLVTVLSNYMVDIDWLLSGAFVVTQHMASVMIPARRGSIIIHGSVYSVTGAWRRTRTRAQSTPW